VETVRIKQVDAFTEMPFGGNPAGVVTVAEGLDEGRMQKIAREMNLSETAFVTPSEKADFRVRFFTPNSEVDLCGHATIGSFAALHEEGRLDAARSVFTQETKAGVLEVERSFRGEVPVFTMTQAKPRFRDTGSSREEAARLLRVDPSMLLDVPPMAVSTGLWWYVIGLKSLSAMQSLAPDMGAIRDFSERHGLIGLVPFCLETLEKGANAHMRAFAPFVAIDEDPVCGTGNGSMGAYIGQYRLVDFDDGVDLVSEAGFEVKRPGRVFVSLRREDGSIVRVKVGGSAVTVLEGTMRFQGEVC
jgi:PhzF family phenazine biosynthesis protein